MFRIPAIGGDGHPGVTTSARPAMLAGEQKKRPAPRLLAGEGERASKDSVMIVPDHGPGVDTPARPERAASGPRWLSFIADTIPHDLTNTAAWYPAVIRPKATVGKWEKRPGDPKTGATATWSNPTTRCTFGQAFTAYELHPEWFDGIGYLMDEAHGLIGIDLDGCVSPDDTVAPWALEIVASFPGAYWEKSISGTGLRGFCRGTLPVGGCRSKIEGSSVELYADQRFLVVTGHTINHAERLPTLQSAVDALHARLTAGRTRATGTAVTSGLIGPNTAPSPEVFQIIEAVMGGRWGRRMTDIWSRDDLHVAGASEDDWALASEIAYQAIQLGYADASLHQLVEESMRAGPYRKKWDERRGAVSWLAQDVANAIATVQKRLKQYQTGPSPEVDDETPVDETLEQKVIRLERENKQLRATNAAQMTVVRNERTMREQAEAGKHAVDALIRAIYETLAIPDEQLAARPKLVSLALAREAASRNSRGIFTMSNLALGKLTGLPEKVVSQIMQDLPAREGTPFERVVTREYVEVSPGISGPRSIAQVRITTPDQTTVSVLRALPAMGGPSDTEMQRLAKARAKTAANTEARIAAEAGKRIGWGWCSTHEATDVNIKGYCSACGEVVGEHQITAEEFSTLNPEIRDSAAQTPPTVYDVTLPTEIRDSAPPVSLPAYAAVRSQPGNEVDGPRCSRPRGDGEPCRATLYLDLGGGRLHCLGCAAVHEPLAAVAGGAE